MKMVTGKMLLPLVAALVFCVTPRPGRTATVPAVPANHPTKLYLFWGQGCPHCAKEEEFLGTLKRKYPGLTVIDFEVWHHADNAKLLGQVIKTARVQVAAVPFTVVGDRIFIGFDPNKAKAIEAAVAACMTQGCADILAGTGAAIPAPRAEEHKTVALPLIGEIDPAGISLPLLTVIIGGLDSFNPCAFFVLLFLLSMLIHARSRPRMLLIGGIFVFFSGFIYFLFMAAWLNIFLVIGKLAAITLSAGIVALIVAVINIKDFFFFKRGVSLMIPEQAKPGLFSRMRGLLKAPTLPAMIGGTAVLAVTANAYELLCTAGFPMVYTRALTLHKLTTAQYYLYLAFYNVVYVIPLAAIVLAVTVSLGARKLTEWQGRQLKLLSGLMMFFLGLILVVNPALLNSLTATGGLLFLVIGIAALTIYAVKKWLPELAEG